MTRSDKKLKELDRILNKENALKITEAINSLRDEQPFEGAIGLLVSYYDKSCDSSISNIIEEFFNDIKDSSTCNEIVAEIRKDFREETLRMIVSSCWQSGLDYSDHISDFLDLFLASGYLTAIECFTVIESALPGISETKRNELLCKIRENAKSVTGDKDALTRELISLLS